MPPLSMSDNCRLRELAGSGVATPCLLTAPLKALLA